MASKVGPMREALKRKMAPVVEPDIADEAMAPDDTDMAPTKEKGAMSEESPEYKEGSADDALSELDTCVEHLPKESKAEASELISRLKELFKGEKEPSETEMGPETGNSTLGAY